METNIVDPRLVVVAASSALFAFLAGGLLTRALIRQRSNPADQAVAVEPARRLRIQALVTTAFRDLVRKDDFTIFLFGPAVEKTTKAGSELERLVAKKRHDLFSKLNEADLFTIYGEELDRLGLEAVDRLNPLLKENLLVSTTNLIILLAVGSGPVAELGFFAADPTVCKKMIIAVHEEDRHGFLSKGLVRQAEGSGARVIQFSTEDVRRCLLATNLFDRALGAYEGYLASRLSARRGIGLMQ